MISQNHLKVVVNRLRNKSINIRTTYKVTAVAYSSKGDILGYSSNNIREDFKPQRRGAGVHAERELIKKFGKKIKYIVISRFGNGGNILPISPCEICQKTADKLGIKIIVLQDILEIN
jgi:tRNA(Arg) A34 adenosine deaminase TadA